jgi:hypothetical protein
VESCPHGDKVVVMHLPQIAEGSEHRVYLHAGSARVFKATRPGLFGESYFIQNEKIFQKNCRPLEYLARLRLWKHLFGSAPKAHGVTSAGQIVSSHEFITGELPSQDEVDPFLIRAGFSPIRQKYWLWQKVYPRHHLRVELGDARDENFVKTPSGIVPIDVRLWAYHFYR